MAKERLSRLQKWILTNAQTFEHGGKSHTAMRRTDIFRFYKWRHTVARGCEDCGGPCKDPENIYSLAITSEYRKYVPPHKYNKANATISRSLRNLRDKGFIKLWGYTEPINKENFMKNMIVANLLHLDKPPTEKDLENFLTPDNIQKSETIWKDTEGRIDVEVGADEPVEIKAKIIELTEKGVAKAQELLKLNS